MPPSTLVGALQSTIGRHGERPALRSKSATFTWRQYFAQAQQFGRACIAVGHKQHEGCAIIGFNSPEWMFANVGAILAGGVAAGIYTSNTPDAAAYVVEHSNSTVVVCEGQQQLDKFLAVRDRLPHVLAYVVYEITPDATRPFVPERTLDAARAARIFSWAQFMALGGATASAGSGAEGAASADAAVAGDGEGDSLLTSPLQQELARRMAAQVPEDVLAYVYTSGTVAMPKAVMVSNDNVMFVATSVLERFAATEAERTVSYLPVRSGQMGTLAVLLLGCCSCVGTAARAAFRLAGANSIRFVAVTEWAGFRRLRVLATRPPSLCALPALRPPPRVCPPPPLPSHCS
jgi:long-chain-fatty-acid--CoA ligase ACSBG